MIKMVIVNLLEPLPEGLAADAVRPHDTTEKDCTARKSTQTEGRSFLLIMSGDCSKKTFESRHMTEKCCVKCLSEHALGTIIMSQIQV